MARPGPSSRSQLRVGRYLGALALLLALLYAGVVFAGPGSTPLTPKLGLDLQGGAQVILTPQTLGGKKATAAQLSTAVEIIRARVNGAGVSEAEVVTEGDLLVREHGGGWRVELAGGGHGWWLRFDGWSAGMTAIPPYWGVLNRPAENGVPGALRQVPSETGGQRGFQRGLPRTGVQP